MRPAIKEKKTCSLKLNSNKKTVVDSDELLIKKSVEGEDESFEELVKRYESRVYNLIYQMVENKDDTEELLQETFIKVYRFLFQFKQKAKFITWIYRIATNLCLQKLKERKNAKCISLDVLLETEINFSHNNITNWSSNPEAILLHKELIEFIEKAIAKLPQRLKISFILRNIEGFSNKEVAQILKSPIGTIKSDIHRTRLYLRQRLNSYLSTSK